MHFQWLFPVFTAKCIVLAQTRTVLPTRNTKWRVWSCRARLKAKTKTCSLPAFFSKASQLSGTGSAIVPLLTDLWQPHPFWVGLTHRIDLPILTRALNLECGDSEVMPLLQHCFYRFIYIMITLFLFFALFAPMQSRFWQLSMHFGLVCM